MGLSPRRQDRKGQTETASLFSWRSWRLGEIELSFDCGGPKDRRTCSISWNRGDAGGHEQEAREAQDAHSSDASRLAQRRLALLKPILRSDPERCAPRFPPVSAKNEVLECHMTPSLSSLGDHTVSRGQERGWTC